MLGREASVLSTSSSSSESRESHERCDDCDNNGLLLSSSTLSTLVRYLAGCSINLVLPFLNGLMLGFGELVAHEVCWQYKWFHHGADSAHKIFPAWRKELAQQDERQETKPSPSPSPSQGLRRRVRDSWDHVKTKFL